MSAVSYVESQIAWHCICCLTFASGWMYFSMYVNHRVVASAPYEPWGLKHPALYYWKDWIIWHTSVQGLKYLISVVLGGAVSPTCYHTNRCSGSRKKEAVTKRQFCLQKHLWMYTPSLLCQIHFGRNVNATSSLCCFLIWIMDYFNTGD